MSNVLTYDLDRLIAGRMLIQANSGGGKSRALRWLLEDTHGKVQQIVLDAEGEFGSLREKFDYILAGKGADIPTDPKTAKVLCRRLLELGASAVIDLYDLSLENRRLFVRLFLEQLMHLPRELWRPLLVVIDECHVFCPQVGSAESSEAVIALATQGRKRGYALVAATQRISKLHKDCAAELLNKMIGRTGLDVDISRAGEELGFSKDDRQGLKWLAPGDFYAYGPALSQEVKLVTTGEIHTTHPTPGQVAPPPPPAPESVSALLGELKDISEESRKEVTDLAEAKAEIKRLQGELRKSTKPVDESAIATAIEEATSPLIQKIDSLELIIAESNLVAADFASCAEQLMDSSQRLRSVLVVSGPRNIAPDTERRELDQPRSLIKEVQREQPDAATPRLPREKAAVDPSNLTPLQQTILNTIAVFKGLNNTTPLLLHVGAFMGKWHNAGPIRGAFSALADAGLVTLTKERIQLTAEGEQFAKHGPIPTLNDIHTMWLNKDKGNTRKMLAEVLKVHPRPISISEMGHMIGKNMNAGPIRGALNSIVSKGLVILDGDFIKATDLLFPEGLK